MPPKMRGGGASKVNAPSQASSATPRRRSARTAATASKPEQLQEVDPLPATKTLPVRRSKKRKAGSAVSGSPDAIKSEPTEVQQPSVKKAKIERDVATPRKRGAEKKEGKLKEKTPKKDEASKIKRESGSTKIEPEISPPPKKSTKKRAPQTTEAPSPVLAAAIPSEPEPDQKPTIKRHRLTPEEKAAAAMPIASRVANPAYFVGAHVSMSGGIQHAIHTTHQIGGNALALFLKSHRKWDSPPQDPERARLFREACVEHGIQAGRHILPHGAYLINLAGSDLEASKRSFESFVDDLRRCEDLGIGLYNFHPGSTLGAPRQEAVKRLADGLNRAHKETKTVKTVLENMAGSSASEGVLGSHFEDLRDVIALIEDKTRVGVCLDTCHTFAAGYDLRSPEAFQKTMEQFDELVGFKYLSALHLNDSKAPLGAHRDLHQNIGLGFLGLRAFHNVMNEPRFRGLPLILETPVDDSLKDETKGKGFEDKATYAGEIKLLESLTGMDPAGEEFLGLESRLAERGEKERQKHQGKLDEKLRKEARKGSRKSKKSKTPTETDDDSA